MEEIPNTFNIIQSKFFMKAFGNLDNLKLESAVDNLNLVHRNFKVCKKITKYSDDM